MLKYKNIEFVVHTEFLKDVYITKILDFMNPRDDTGKLIFPSKKPMKSQMNNLK